MKAVQKQNLMLRINYSVTVLFFYTKSTQKFLTMDLSTFANLDKLCVPRLNLFKRKLSRKCLLVSCIISWFIFSLVLRLAGRRCLGVQFEVAVGGVFVSVHLHARHVLLFRTNVLVDRHEALSCAAAASAQEDSADDDDGEHNDRRHRDDCCRAVTVHVVRTCASHWSDARLLKK